MKTARLPLVSMVPMLYESDCGIAALAMWLHCSYLSAALAYDDAATVMRSGAWRSQIMAAAEALGVQTRVRRKFDVDDDAIDGIIQVRLHKDRMNHVAVLRSGLLWDTDLCVWEPSDYLVHRHASWGWLLVRQDAK